MSGKDDTFRFPHSIIWGLACRTISGGAGRRKDTMVIDTSLITNVVPRIVACSPEVVEGTLVMMHATSSIYLRCN